MNLSERMRNGWKVLLAVGIVLGGVLAYRSWSRAGPQAEFRMATVEHGDLLVTIGATGIIKPEDEVDIGAQVVGKIKSLGIDLRSETDPAFKDKTIDYCSTVRQGMILACIDDSLYRATFNQAKASLDRAEADLLELQAKREQTEAEWMRAQKLRELKLTSVLASSSKSNPLLPTPIKGISDADYILAKANYEVAKANVEVGKAVIEQEKATLQLAETNLNYTVIKSPINGTIIDRKINVGQTVVSSFNAPSLFLIAKDLRKMQVWTSVNEADIGRLKLGMPVHFLVDAFPNDRFEGRIAQIRLNASQNQNVTTYPVVVSTDNSNLRLLPYLTADVKFEVDDRPNVLMVPNAALRYEPRPELIEPGSEIPKPTASANRSRSKLEQDHSVVGEDIHAKGAPKRHEERRRLWVKDGSLLKSINVLAGATDGTSTEVSGPDVQEGLEVVVSETHNDQANDTRNPFAPRFGGGGGKGGSGKGVGRSLR